MIRRAIVLSSLVIAALAAAAGSATAATAAWTTYRHDAARSGIDPDSSTPVANPSEAWQTVALDGQVYAQPLVYGGYVYVATENDTVYELNAATGQIVWQSHLATPEPASAAPCGDITPSVGITSTPVIDPSSNRLYAVGAVSSSGSVSHQLFALDLATGALRFKIGVDPPFPSGGAPINQLQRAALALDGGRVLIGYGGNDGDCATYWGWLVSAPTDGSGSTSSFQVDRDYSEGAIWGAGNGPAVDGAGNAYIATGNGSGNTSSNPEYGESVVKLDAAASPIDYWTPGNWQSLDSSDTDIGSSMPTLLPGGYLFQSGKDGNGYVLNEASLGHVGNATAQVNGFCGDKSMGGSVYYPATATIYAACGSDTCGTCSVKALTLSAGSPPTVARRSGFSAPSGTIGPPMIAAGLVWVTGWTNRTLYALNPQTGAAAHTFPIPESGSNVNHFASPSAGGGRLFVASGNQVTAFAVAQTPPPGPTATTTTLASSANPAPAGAAVTLTATVSPAPDGGTVAFTAGGSPLPGCAAVAVASGAGTASCGATFPTPGARTIVAAYSGDPGFAASTSSPLVQSVTAGSEGTSTPGAPTISHLKLSPRRFAVPRRVTLRLTASEAATVTVTVTELRRGHAVHGRCSLHARRGRACAVRVTVLRIRLHARRGANAFRLLLRRLEPRPYAAYLSATDAAGRRSRALRVTFTVVRRR